MTLQSKVIAKDLHHMNYTTLASKETVEKTAEGLKARNFNPVIVASGKDAFEYIKGAIPAGASVMNGSSTTLEQIGFVEYLKAGAHGWNNLHADIVAEKDGAKQAELRKLSVTSDYYLGSVHALTEGGEMVIASNTGSQQPHLVFTSPNLILVVSTQKIVPSLEAAIERLEKHVIPLEDAHMMKKYGSGTKRNKTVILHGENPMMKRTITVVLVNEKLGF